MGIKQGSRSFQRFGYFPVTASCCLLLLIGTVVFSFYALGRLRLHLQSLDSTAVLNSFHLVEWSVYAIAGVTVFLFLLGVFLLFRQYVQVPKGAETPVKISPHQDKAQIQSVNEPLLFMLLDALPSCIFIKDTNLHYLFANKMWLENHGLTLDNIIGKSEIEVFGETPTVLENTKDERCLIDGTVARLQKERQDSSDGRTLTFLSDVVPLNSPSGELISIGGWLRDISHYKRTNEALDQARQQADTLNRAKSSFLATMSHEIRTPMNGVVGSLDLLRVTQLDESQRQLVDTVNESAFSLLTIINDILDFSKIESGKLEFDPVPVNMERLLVSVASSLMPSAQQKEVELLVYTDVDVPDVYADLVRLRQIITNLVSNAIKFSKISATDKSRVVLRCSISPGSVDKTQPDTTGVVVKLSVEDNGIGISKDAQNHLFQPFVQAESSTTRRFGGSGLGLSITSRLVSMMEGEIHVQSTPDIGSIFTVLLPFQLVDNHKMEQTPLSLANLPVLFVKGEDEMITRIFTHHLQSSGAACSTVTRNQTDWFEISVTPKDQLVIVIVDCWANDLGLPVVKEQLEKHYSSVCDLSFVILSQGYLLEPQLQGESTIKVAYNGLGRMEFLKAIDSLVSKTRVENVRSTVDIATSDAKLLAFSAQKKCELLLIAEDNEVNQKVLKRQAEVLGYSVEIANDGEEALSMWMRDKDKYALILTDCHMPNLDGYGLAKAIRAQEQSKDHIPIIAITADALQGAADACYQAGMDDYLVKPLLITDLYQKLEKWVIDSSPLSPVTEVESASVSGEASDVVDATSLPEFLGTTDQALLKEFYREYQRTASLYVGEVDALLNDHNLEALGALAHKLKSSSYTVGAIKLGDSCLALEVAARSAEVDNSKTFDQQPLDEVVAQLQAFYTEVDHWIEAYCSTVNTSKIH